MLKTISNSLIRKGFGESKMEGIFEAIFGGIIELILDAVMSLFPQKEETKAKKIIVIIVKLIVSILVVGLMLAIIIGFFALIEHFFPRVIDFVRFD
jgi:hypothetical protein